MKHRHCLVNRLLTAAVAVSFCFLLTRCDRANGPQKFILPVIDSVHITTVPLPVRVSLSVPRTSVPRYGILPQICLHANSDNSFDAAVYISSQLQPLIMNFNPDGGKRGEFFPAAITEARGLLGMTKIPDDGSYVVGWSRNNAHGDAAFEYWITRFDRTGGELFSSRLFGDSSSAEVYAQGQPGAASTGRIVYNETTGKIGFYCGHTKKWPDSVRHQGGYIGFMNLDGSYYVANDWYFSHNFDQRLVVVDSFYYALAHGDAYPRALGFSKWSDALPRGRRIFDRQYFPIAGASGDNTTATQTGGLIPLSDSTFGVVFSTAIGRQTYDVCFMKLSAQGEVLTSRWLTSYLSPQFALFPRIAPYGRDILLAWEEVSGGDVTLRALVVDNNGSALSPFATLHNVRLSPWYDLVALPNNDVIWAVPNRTSDSLSICRIKGPPPRQLLLSR
ncbi:MAG: hypothetical protein JXA71_01180 [Chitinispirillaceae bacterium]|nr:hypothetical protein [Chitinispirillaceae bacterium]